MFNPNISLKIRFPACIEGWIALIGEYEYFYSPLNDFHHFRVWRFKMFSAEILAEDPETSKIRRRRGWKLLHSMIKYWKTSLRRLISWEIQSSKCDALKSSFKAAEQVFYSKPKLARVKRSILSDLYVRVLFFFVLWFKDILDKH